MDIQEIIQLLERIAELLYQRTEGYCPWCGAKDYPVCDDKQGYDKVKPEDAEEWRIDHSETCIVVSIDQALIRLKQPKCKTCGDTRIKWIGHTHTRHRVSCPDCQQPTATSIGNKIREIASKDILGQTKLVRDKDILNQAADRLDAWWKYIGELKEQIKAKDELLFAYESVRAPKQPTAGEWAKKFNGLIEEIKSMFTVSQAMAKNSFDSTLQIPVEGETDNPDPLPNHEYPQQPIAGIDIKSKRKTIEAADISPQEEWWKKNLLEAYTEIENLKQQPTAGEYETRTIENTYICPCGNIFVEDDDYDTLGSESGVLCPNCGNEKFQTVKARLDRAEAINKDLLGSCERMLGAMACDELNNGQVFDDDLRKEVKIQAIAAIAKAKKEGGE